MNVLVHIEAHAFAEEKLCDQDFDNPPHYGIVGPEIMLPLALDVSFYARWGEWFAWLCALLYVTILISAIVFVCE